MNNKAILIIGLILAINCMPASSQAKTDKHHEAQRIMLNNKEYYLHVIQRGEGLYRISVNYGVSMQEILDANDDMDELLKVGQILRIPVIPGRNSTGNELNNAASYIYHTIEKGQTAYFISQKYKIPLDTIYKYNPGTKQGLLEGAVLIIPAKEMSTQVESLSVEFSESLQGEDDHYIYHTVKPKETLFGLSRLYHTTTEEIIEANPALRTGILSIGSKVRIPKVRDEGVSLSLTDSSDQHFVEVGDYIYHIITEGQTLFSISRQYQVNISEIEKANPGITSDNMRVGYMLRIPRVLVDQKLAIDPPDESELFITHRVRRRETLFGISRQYHVDMDIIREVNENVDFKNFKNGIRLKIPTDAWFAMRATESLAQIGDTISIADAEEKWIPLLGECSVNSIIGYNEPVRLALILPFLAAESNRLYAISDDTIQISKEIRTRVSQSKIFSEFYSGVLLALDTLKKSGISVELAVYDISDKARSINKVMEDPSLKRAHLIIGPGMSAELPALSEFSRKNKIPLVFPLSNTNPEIFNNPYLFQINTPDSLLYQVMTDEIIFQAQDANLLVIMPSKQDSQANSFVRILKQKASEQIGGTSSFRYSQFTSGENDLIELQNIISNDSPNYVIIPSGNEADVSNILPILAGVKKETKADIRIYGMPDWLRFQTIDPEQMHQLNASIFRPFALDYHDRNTQKFLNKYRQWFYTEPHAVNPYFQNSTTSSSYSRFGAWGYDVTNYFISAIVQYGSDFDLCIDKFHHEQVQFNFNFQRISNWGGFYNQGLVMIKFNPDLSTQRIQVKIENR